MKYVFLALAFITISAISALAGFLLATNPTASADNIVYRTLEREPDDRFAPYSIETLAASDPGIVDFSLEKELSEEDTFSSNLFSMDFDPTFSHRENKTITGMLSIPKAEGTFPLVIMVRGFVDQSIYQTGVGTRRAAEVFAENGFITVAPDFLGYGSSSRESENIFETRFQTYTTMLALLSVINEPSFAKAVSNKWDGRNVFFWAHSNGGQITLTVLAITGLEYPTTLWAPVTKPFPYSVLYYTDESRDGGKFIRSELAHLEADYDTDLFSFSNYLDRIKAPIQLHQGSADEAIPVAWSNNAVKLLRDNEVDVTYHVYPGADHNLQPSWDLVVARDLEFFREFTKTID